MHTPQALPPSATTADLHNARMAHVSRASCAVHARSLNLQHMLVLGKGYEGTEPTPHMLAGRGEPRVGELVELQALASPAALACRPQPALLPLVPPSFSPLLSICALA